MDAITSYPVTIEGEQFTIKEIHEGPQMGLITLSGEDGDTIRSAVDVPRRLYAVAVIHPTAGRLGPVTGSYGQPISYTFSEALSAIADFTPHVGTATPAGTSFVIEVAL